MIHPIFLRACWFHIAATYGLLCVILRTAPEPFCQNPFSHRAIQSKCTFVRSSKFLGGGKRSKTNRLPFSWHCCREEWDVAKGFAKRTKEIDIVAAVQREEVRVSALSRTNRNSTDNLIPHRLSSEQVSRLSIFLMETVLYRRTFGHVPNKLRKRKTCGGGLKASLVSKVPYKCRVCVCVLDQRAFFLGPIYISHSCPVLLCFCFIVWYSPR